MHAGAATRLNTATLLISADQADEITSAGARVARHYDIAVLDPKWQDWFAFAGTLAKTYGGMAMAFYAERQGSAGSQAPHNPGGSIAPNPTGANGLSPAAQPVPVAIVPHHTGAVN